MLCAFFILSLQDKLFNHVLTRREGMDGVLTIIFDDIGINYALANILELALYLDF